MRNDKGQFMEGDETAKKPKYCPHCNKEIEIRTYAYIDKKHLEG